MQNAKFAKSYMAAMVKTATPAQLVLMLYDGALRFMATAKQGFSEEDFSKRNETIHNNLQKTQAILRELQISLDMQVGGEFPDRMHALYGFMMAQIQQANLKKEIGPIHVVEKLLGDIRDAWAQMLKQSATVKAA